jgi:hypothetical protein
MFIVTRRTLLPRLAAAAAASHPACPAPTTITSYPWNIIYKLMGKDNKGRLIGLLILLFHVEQKE